MKSSKRSLFLSAITVLILSATGAYFLSPGFLKSPSLNTGGSESTHDIFSSDAVELTPENVLPYTLMLPDREKQKADHERNLAFYQKRAKQAPKSFMDQNLLANAYMAQGKFTHDTSWYLLAQKAAERSLALQTVNPGAWQVLFSIAQARHDFVTAEKLHRQITEAAVEANNNILANHISQRMAQNKLLEAKEAAKQWVRKEPLISALSQLALVEEAQGQYDDALAHLYKGISREQIGDTLNSSQARAWAGRILAKKGFFDLAKRFYTEALRIEPQNMLAQELQGDLAFKEKQYSKALEAYGKAYAVDNAPLFLIKQAQVYSVLNEEEKANTLKSQAEAALRRELATHSFGHRRELALLLLEKNLPESLLEAKTIMEQEYQMRQDPKTVFVLAQSLSANQQWNKAQEVIQKALNQGAVEGVLLKEAARTEAHLGDTQKAASYSQAAERYDQSLHELSSL